MQKGDCERLPPRRKQYDGLTTNTLSRRLSFHLQSGAIRHHFETKHNTRITRKEIVNWTRIRYQVRDTNRLKILEALIINAEDPELNRQDTGKVRILKLYGNIYRGSSLGNQPQASMSPVV